MKKGALSLLILVFCVSSCIDLVQKVNEAANGLDSSTESTSEGNYKTVSIDSLFQVDVPKYMKPIPNLNPEGVLEYGNIFKEAYFVVINEDKQEYIDVFKELGEYNDELPVIENYKNVQKKMFAESIENIRIQEYGLNNINNKPARQIKVFGEVDGIKAAYIIAFVEGENNIFMLMNWTINDRLKKFENSFEYTNSTFKIN